MSDGNLTTVLETPRGNGRSSLGFYTPSEASRIARVPQWTVSSWRRKGIVLPPVEWIDENHKAHIGHTFETLVFMRLIRMLRDQHYTLFNAASAVKSLRERFGPPNRKWADVRIFTDGREVYVYGADEWETTVATRGHQKLAEFFFGDAFIRLRDRTDALLIPEKYMDFVEVDPAIKNGLPVVLDTPVPTSLIHSLRNKGFNNDDVHEMYPFIARRYIAGADDYETFLDQSQQRLDQDSEAVHRH